MEQLTKDQKELIAMIETADTKELEIMKQQMLQVYNEAEHIVHTINHELERRAKK